MDHDILVDLYDLLIVLNKRDILGSIDVRQSGISSNIVNTLDISEYQEWKVKMHQGPNGN